MVISLALLKRGWASPIWSPHKETSTLCRARLHRALFSLNHGPRPGASKIIAANRPSDRGARGRRPPSLPPGNLGSTRIGQVTRLAGRVCIDESAQGCLNCYLGSPQELSHGHA